MADEALPPAAVELKDEGNALLKRGDVAGAVAKYSDALALAPDSAVLLSNRSAAHAKAGDAEAALADAQRCVALAPAWGKAYSRLAHALKECARDADALAAARQGLALDPDNAPLRALAQRLAAQDAFEKLRGPWHGTVAEEVGGYVQEFDFWSPEDVRVSVLGTVVEAKYAVDATAEPHPRMDLEVPSSEGTPRVRQIYRFQGNDVLDVCSPYLTPPDVYPTEFQGPGFVRMHRGRRVVSAEETKRRDAVRKLSIHDKMLHFTRDVIAVLPDFFTRPFPETDSEAELTRKVSAHVRFQTQYQALLELYGPDTEARVKNLVVGVEAFTSESDELRKAVAAFREGLQKAGLMPSQEEMDAQNGAVSGAAHADASVGEDAKAAARADDLQKVVLQAANAVNARVAEVDEDGDAAKAAPSAKAEAEAATPAPPKASAKASAPAKASKARAAPESDSTIATLAVVGVALAVVSVGVAILWRSRQE